MTGAHAWAWSAFVFGLAAFAISIAFALLPEVRAAAGCLDAGAVIRFELARSAADLAAIFGDPGAACRQSATAAVDAVNRLDMLAFIPSYTAFCVAGAFFLSGGAFRLLAGAAALSALGAAAGDYLETTTLLSLTQSLDTPDALLPRLGIGAWSKFWLLAVHGVFCSGMCFNAEKQRPILGVLLLLPTAGVAAAAWDHARFAGVLNPVFTIAWLSLLALAARSAFSRS